MVSHDEFPEKPEVEKLFEEWNKIFISKQTELDEEAEKVLRTNLWDLYE